MTALFASVGLSGTGYIAAVTVSVLIAEDLLGSVTYSGLPNALATLGRAAGSTILSMIMLRHGRRAGLILGFLVGGGAILVALAGTAAQSFSLFLVGLFLYGLGFGGTHLARYAAADLYPAALRSSAISWIVWAGTIGSVLGPALLAPTQSLALRLGLPGLTGAHLLAAVASILAAMVLWGMVRGEDFPSAPREEATTTASGASPLAWLRLPRVRLAILAMMVGQSVMVFLMAMTPIYMRAAGKGLASIGIAMSAHTLGMFALSPVSGWFSDRFGRLTAIATGSGLLVVSAALAFFAKGDQVALLSVSIFLLGLGWNLGFVSGSALLTESVQPNEMIRAQGIADTLAWIVAAAAGLASGMMLSAWGFPTLATIGGMVALLPLLAVTRHYLLPPRAEQP